MSNQLDLFGERKSHADDLKAKREAARGSDYRGAEPFELNEDDEERRESVAQRLLNHLHANGPCSTIELCRPEVGGHRFSTAVQALRERGYHITRERGEGREHIYELIGFEKLVQAGDDIKAAYYATAHWRRVARERKEFDGCRCTKCHSRDHLHTHHWVYHLFEEELYQLQTYCSDCHGQIHDWCSVAFPKSLPLSIVQRIREG